eukprot:3311274-Pyramimonas_sp.AAC.1
MLDERRVLLIKEATSVVAPRRRRHRRTLATEPPAYCGVAGHSAERRLQHRGGKAKDRGGPPYSGLSGGFGAHPRAEA